MGMDHDKQYLRYLGARVGAFQNVWWSMANECELAQLTNRHKNRGQAATPLCPALGVQRLTIPEPERCGVIDTAWLAVFNRVWHWVQVWRSPRRQLSFPCSRAPSAFPASEQHAGRAREAGRHYHGR